MKRAMLWAAAALFGLLLGGGSAIWSAGQPFDGVRNGSWTASTQTGSRDADAWTRARVAVQALLAMTSDQAIYFTSRRDSEGRALDADCRYAIRGGGYPARWWSVTLYDDAYFLIEDAQKRYSVTAASLDPDASGRWSARIGRDPSADLATPPTGGFNLILRLYHPDPSVLQDPASIDMPLVEREGCA